ncbi:MAG: hypothetical protein AABY50_09270 [Nitrospirota bacterium]
MANIDLSPEDLQLLPECINEQKDIPAEILTKLPPGFFEKLAADKIKIVTVVHGRRLIDKTSLDE